MKRIQCCTTLLQTCNFRLSALQHPLAQSSGGLSKRGFLTANPMHSYDIRNIELLTQDPRKMCFDTHALVLELQNNGFPKEQAEAIVTIISNLTCTNMESTYRDMVTKAQQEIMMQQIMAHLDSIRKDMVILEKSEFSNLRMENEKIKIELEHLKQQLLDEVKKIRSDTKLDMNLEKSRIMDMFREREKQLMTSRNEFTELNSGTDRAITETNKKIDTDVASLKTMLESLKLETMRYLAASVFTCLAIALGFYRLWQK
ncbi:coiled-coil domain-containing protein 90B, mitochondrial isoform X1 [Scyliorhinus canicula]|uniref:coiled-coil domain-containing protein 90B, mitochondrial isoform X1 n=1 Tax=Scyliorhinus canicula TaxID=7830 RepID=UPI0018F48184|nr:coiled-coil domain-containing protein 90B, mitochondrial isoform X1 [Scyliorhinus canicula]